MSAYVHRSTAARRWKQRSPVVTSSTTVVTTTRSAGPHGAIDSGSGRRELVGHAVPSLRQPNPQLDPTAISSDSVLIDAAAGAPGTALVPWRRRREEADTVVMDCSSRSNGLARPSPSSGSQLSRRLPIVTWPAVLRLVVSSSRERRTLTSAATAIVKQPRPANATISDHRSLPRRVWRMVRRG